MVSLRTIVKDEMREPYKTLIEKLIESLKRKYEDRFISLIVFGSVARGEMRKDSDIDLLLIIDSLLNGRLERQKEFIEVEKEMEDYLNALFDEGYFVDFSPIIKTPEEAMKISPLYLDMVEDATIAYDKDDFFKNILESIRNSRILRREREPSMYGDEELALPPDELYTFEDAKTAFDGCVLIFNNCKKLLDEAESESINHHPQLERVEG